MSVNSMNIDALLTKLRLTRAMFLTAVIGAASAVIGVIIGIADIGFFFTPLINPTKGTWINLGSVNKYKVGEMAHPIFRAPSSPEPWSGVVGLQAVWLRRLNKSQFVAFSPYCTHLGCPVKYIASADLFLCPCHGSAFYGDGTVAAGPAQLPLVQLKTRVVRGNVYVYFTGVPVISS
jgi:menaquinol-cytochrome c reductase iron-sulfur subunit